jgi:hypothetical protein
MEKRWIPGFAAGLTASLLVNVVLVLFLLTGRAAAPAFGDSGSEGGFIVSSSSDACFILRTQKPHLLVYKTDPAGQLQLTSSRKIECDLLLPDNFMPKGQIKGALRTLPPIREVCGAVKELEREEKKKAKEEDEPEEKKEGKKTEGKTEAKKEEKE